jgi:hypothetical protein
MKYSDDILMLAMFDTKVLGEDQIFSEAGRKRFSVDLLPESLDFCGQLVIHEDNAESLYQDSLTTI